MCIGDYTLAGKCSVTVNMIPASIACAVLTVHSVLAGRPVHTEDALPDVAVLPQTGPDGYCPSSLGWGKCTEWDMYQQWSCDV